MAPTFLLQKASQIPGTAPLRVCDLLLHHNGGGRSWSYPLIQQCLTEEDHQLLQLVRRARMKWLSLWIEEDNIQFGQEINLRFFIQTYGIINLHLFWRL